MSSVAFKVRANGASIPVLQLALNEGAGTTSADSSGLGNNATFTGTGNTWVAGASGFGNAVNFTGTGGLSVTMLIR